VSGLSATTFNQRAIGIFDNKEQQPFAILRDVLITRLFFLSECDEYTRIHRTLVARSLRLRRPKDIYRLARVLRLTSNSAMSSTFSPPSVPAMPSVIMFKQNGQAVTQLSKVSTFPTSELVRRAFKPPLSCIFALQRLVQTAFSRIHPAQHQGNYAP
jgi:hypothetical protein